MKMKSFLITLMISLLILGCQLFNPSDIPPKKLETPIHALHLLHYDTDQQLEELGQMIPKFVELHINTIVLEVDYFFTFKSHPELRQGENPITKKGARKFAKICRKNGVQLITQFQCLGHQSWAEETFPLLTNYPNFDLTPGAFPDNKDIYCREWDLMNPEVNKIVFELMDEIIDAFQVSAFHVGMDEVFLLGCEESPSTKGKDPGMLYAKAVNDMYNHLVKERGMEMLMWGDRLIDGIKYPYGEWESSLNGTATAVDSIPKDIIICDWHYEKLDSFPSIPMFIDKGFRVIPTSWRDVEATKALIQYSQQQDSTKMIGHLFTMWSLRGPLEFPPILECGQLLVKKNE